MRQTERSLPSAILLFFVAPFVAEYLLGDLPLKLLPAMIVLAPMYGGGALLIREIARRRHRGWPTMLLLGAAYTVIEEGFVGQSLFNPDYLRLHLHFLVPAHIAWLGTGGWWTLFMFNLHVFWSIGVSIALVEALHPKTATNPWLGVTGDAVIGFVFVLGLAANSFIGWKQNHFSASLLQFTVAGVAVVLFVALAFLVRDRHSVHGDGAAFSPLSYAGLALVLGSLVLLVPSKWGWGAVSALAVIDATFLTLVFVSSWGSNWSQRQTFGLAAGGALAYGFHAFIQPPVAGGTRAAAHLGNAIFLGIALVLILIGARRTAGLSHIAAQPTGWAGTIWRRVGRDRRRL